MEPLIVLVVVTLVLLAAGATGVRWLQPWPVALRGGLAAMFVLTGMAHFVGMRAELISMVPPSLPAPGLLVTVTGVLELAGAVGLLWTRTSPWAAGGLSALLVSIFPANVYAALEGLTSTAADELVPAVRCRWSSWPRPWRSWVTTCGLAASLRPRPGGAGGRACSPGRPGNPTTVIRAVAGWRWRRPGGLRPA